ncbi:hypothetical protein OBBRIDRAFT_838862 [Obba rivulosa]|uniref:Uncharacterized protein n=1 Tax=Obba rivulosa TaxID=1052685 RepID=A0A8E2AJA0_9APHY|nr:hypothetical protein OBBRIDRAFT_838862 [Obba rivulosa]
MLHWAQPSARLPALAHIPARDDVQTRARALPVRHRCSSPSSQLRRRQPSPRPADVRGSVRELGHSALFSRLLPFRSRGVHLCTPFPALQIASAFVRRVLGATRPLLLRGPALRDDAAGSQRASPVSTGVAAALVTF